MIIMRLEKYLFLVCLLISPQLLLAENKEGHKYTAKEDIAFTPSSQAAFDRSGQMVTHSILADGSLLAEHNGSLGHVTVARLGPDGSVETYCTTHSDAANSWMAGGDTGKFATPLNARVDEK